MTTPSIALDEESVTPLPETGLTPVFPATSTALDEETLPAHARWLNTGYLAGVPEAWISNPSPTNTNPNTGHTFSNVSSIPVGNV